MIVLSILKWLFIILFLLIVLIIGIILFILLSKLTFEVSGVRKVDKEEWLKIKGYYLLGIFRYSLDYDKNEGLSYQVFIFQKKILCYPKKQFINEPQIQKSGKENILNNNQSSLLSLEDNHSQSKTNIKDIFEHEKASNINKDNDINEQKKIPLVEKIRRFKNNIIEKKDKLFKLKSQISDIGLSELFKELKRTILYIKPSFKCRKLHGNLFFGFESPEQTGYVTALLYYILPIKEKYHLNLYPSFEEKIVEGDIILKGDIRFIRWAIGGITLFLSKPVQRILKMRR